MRPTKRELEAQTERDALRRELGDLRAHLCVALGLVRREPGSEGLDVLNIATDKEILAAVRQLLVDAAPAEADQVDVGLPGRRADIINALTVLATVTPATLHQWPGLTEAVHWLVDDTGWDLYYDTGQERFNPARAIGDFFRDGNEVAAIDAVLVPLLGVLDELGPLQADTEYLDHQLWPEVAAAAHSAHTLLSSGA